MPVSRQSNPLRKILGACGVLFALSIVCCGGVGLGVHDWYVDKLKALPPYQSLNWVVRDGGTVRQQLGEPITYGRWISGKHVQNGKTDDLYLKIPTEGPYASGFIELSANGSDGEWELTQLELHTESESDIDLLPDLERLERERLTTVVQDLVQQGQAHESTGAHRQAEETYARALSFDADAQQALLGRGRVRRNLADFDGARQDLDRFLALVPDDETGLLELGQVHAAANRPKQCVQVFTTFLRLRPEDAAAWFHRAACFEAMGERRSAAAGAREACRMGHGMACAMSERLNRKR